MLAPQSANMLKVLLPKRTPNQSLTARVLIWNLKLLPNSNLHSLYYILNIGVIWYEYINYL